MDISYLDFFLINTLLYIGGFGTGLLVCCKHKDYFLGSESSVRELDGFQVSHTYSPPQAEVIATAPPADQVNKGIRIVLE